MKIRNLFFSLALILVSSQGAFATETLNISGGAAQNLMIVLQRTGATTRAVPGGASLSVSRIECAEGGGFVYLPMHCRYFDRLTGRSRAADASLAQALQMAGVRPFATAMGELHEVRLDVFSVSCSRAGIRSVSCDIQL